MNKLIPLLALVLLSACSVDTAEPVAASVTSANCRVAAVPNEYCAASMTWHRPAAVTYQCAEGTAADLDGRNITGLQEPHDCFTGDPNDRMWCCVKVAQ